MAGARTGFAGDGLRRVRIVFEAGDLYVRGGHLCRDPATYGEGVSASPTRWQTRDGPHHVAAARQTRRGRWGGGGGGCLGLKKATKFCLLGGKLFN